MAKRSILGAAALAAAVLIACDRPDAPGPRLGARADLHPAEAALAAVAHPQTTAPTSAAAATPLAAPSEPGQERPRDRGTLLAEAPAPAPAPEKPAAVPAEAKPQAAKDARDGKAPFKLGVVNLLTCFDKDRYDRVKDVDVELQKFAEDYKKQVEDLEKRILQLKQQLEALDKNQPLYQQKRRDLVLTETELKYTREMGRIRFLENYNEVKREVYNEIRRVVTMIAQEQNFDLVLRVEQPQLEEAEDRGLSFQIASRVVLFAQPGVDITPQVVERLNQEYKKQKAAQGHSGAEWECPGCKVKNKTDVCSKCNKRKP